MKRWRANNVLVQLCKVFDSHETKQTTFIVFNTKGLFDKLKI